MFSVQILQFQGFPREFGSKRSIPRKYLDFAEFTEFPI